ncbi:MAG: putative transporter ATP-binding protein [Micavibrio sp.]|nr:putative transporter ATP-binding protein [Micavibrio sp.]
MKQTIILPPVEKMPVESNSFFRWIGFFLSPYRATFWGFLSFRVFRYTLISLVPLMIGLLINGFEKGWAYSDPHKLVAMTAGFLIIYTLTQLSIIVFIREAKMEDRVIRGLTLFSIRHINALPLTWHESQGSGSKLQRVMQARNSLKQIYMVYKWSAVPFVASLGAIALSIHAMDVPGFFYWLFTGFTASFLVVGYYSARPIPELHNKHNAILERLMSGVYEFVSAVRTVKAFHMGEYIESEARRFEEDGHVAMSRIYRATYTKWVVLNMTGIFWISAFIIACVMGVYHHWLSTGAFAMIFFQASNLWNRLEEMVYMQDQFMESRNGFMRLTETLKAQRIEHDIAPLQPLLAWPSMKFDHVNFAYPGSGKDGEEAPPALHDIDLTIGKGEKIALVGRSGAGKSTFVKLLMKQMLPTSGKILVDTVALDHIATREWLAKIGFVPQDIELFNMSIRDNILLDAAYEGNEAVYETALQQAALDELIQSLPEGDETLVGERGIKLSGGQRQRLGIARALVRNADMIIFDEATASLDSLSEQVIQKALTTAFAGRTMVIIAHRLSTVRFADRIIVMEDGRIVENGTFDDLITKGGKFATLWALQSSGFVDESESIERPDEPARQTA